MKIDLKNKKEKLENYIRSIGYETTGLELKSDQALIDQAIIDSYKQDEKKDLVSLIDIIEVTSKEGKYEEIDLDKVGMIEIGDTFFLSNHMQRKVRRSPINPGINEFN